ncbi:MAG: AIR synthase-related protein, partial [Thermoproteota archaeon]
ALAEMALAGSTGFAVNLDAVPNSCDRIDDLLFSESHSRYVIGTKEPEQVRQALSSTGVAFSEIGKAARTVEFAKDKGKVIRLTLKQLQTSLYSLGKVMQ